MTTQTVTVDALEQAQQYERDRLALRMMADILQYAAGRIGEVAHAADSPVTANAVARGVRQMAVELEDLTK